MRAAGGGQGRSRVRRPWTGFAVLGLAITLAGCGAELGGFQPTFDQTMLWWAGWDSLSTDSCWGNVTGWAGNATNVQLHFWYATGNGETVRVLRDGQTFPVPAQITRGEARFPRVGAITWDGGGTAAQPRAPVVWLGGQRPYWSAMSADSMQALLGNNGGVAYHVTVTIEGRNGIEVLSSIPDRLEMDRSAYVRTVPVGVTGAVAPRILKVAWEDYGGIRDSTVSP